MPEDSSDSDEDEHIFEKGDESGGADSDDKDLEEELENVAEEMAYKRQSQPISKGGSQQPVKRNIGKQALATFLENN